MMPHPAIAPDDLDVLAEVAMMRLPLRAAESQRIEAMRVLLEAAAELSRALASHTHCALVNFRGSHGAGDLRAETDALSAALDRYARLVRETAAEYRRLVRDPSRVPGEPMMLAGSAGGAGDFVRG
jgi:hypothetical protein